MGTHQPPRVVAKHKLVVIEDDKRPVELCDVMSWDDDSTQLPHGISIKLEITTRRKTHAKLIKHLPKFRLTPRADEAMCLKPILDRLRKNQEAAVVILNKRGWVGYLLPHNRDAKLYCHFHHQAHMDAAHQRRSKPKPAKMSRLEPVTYGPWARKPGTLDFREEFDGPDYDPALVYTMDELDPFKDAPKLPDTQPALPVLDDKTYEMSTFEDDLRIHREKQKENDFTPHRHNGYSHSHGSLLSAQAEAAAKYGEELRTESQQASSFIYHLKRFNNWVKATLISKASKNPVNAGLRVLDLACGKGGDLGKWATHPDGIEKYVGSDIAFGSLEHLVERLAKSVEKGGRTSWRKIPVKLFEADLGQNDVQRDQLKVWENMGARRGEWNIRIPLNEDDLFDVASMQFALHYMGQTEHRMRRFLNEVSRHLRVGGVFIATTMDSRVLMQLLMGHAERSWDSSRQRTIYKVEIEDERRNNLLSIAFKDPPQSYLRSQSQDDDSYGPFGLEYTFTLRETELNKNAVDNVPEWMLPLDALKDAAADYGLHLETAQNFHEFFAHESQIDPARLNLRNMHVFNPKGTMNDTEWRIAGIYIALVFRKTSKDIAPADPASAPLSPPYPPPPQYPPASPNAPPSDWEGPPPRFQPASPDHPPPDYM